MLAAAGVTDDTERLTVSIQDGNGVRADGLARATMVLDPVSHTVHDLLDLAGEG